ncbi:Deleted in malignant brain tumors 1 protein [Holothuria leucospilota]|uniref:Deleted in malignant brain tumors 1 protein n=1 Tax=Holothuria leucospilota TaxID=206669 RepID=A0A9Q1BBP0_HOLLE|nr:Deleted in malignant brain tumors 1 protein [Holothuria leucospilota]
MKITTLLPILLNTEDGLQGIRLVDGSSDSSGRVEVFMNGGWRTVCDDGWDLEDAIVVCRQLGYQNATSAPRRAFFGQGIGPIWKTDLQCTGSEASLTECSQRSLRKSYCNHYEDAGVACEGKKDHFRLRKLSESDKETKTSELHLFRVLIAVRILVVYIFINLSGIVSYYILFVKKSYGMLKFRQNIKS